MFAWDMADYSQENHTDGVHGEPYGGQRCFAVQQIRHPLGDLCCSMASTLIHSQLYTD